MKTESSQIMSGELPESKSTESSTAENARMCKNVSPQMLPPEQEASRNEDTDSGNAAVQNPKWHLPVAIVGTILLMVLCGGILAYAKVPFASLEESQTKEDRLAGIFITNTYIEPGAPQVDFNARGEIILKEQEPNKIYGTYNEPHNNRQQSVTFPGVDGFGIYNLQLLDEWTQQPSGYYTCDEIFTEVHFTSSDTSDTGTEDHSEASVYVKAGKPCAYYFNPVYQQADGQIYLLQGQGISSDSFTEGIQWSQSLSQSVSQSVNGIEETEMYRYSITVIATEAPEEMELLFVDAKNQVLQSMSGEELETIYQKEDSQLSQLEIPGNVAYLILRQTKGGSKESTHTLFDRGMEYLEYMVTADDDFLRPHQLLLIWQ